MWRISCLVLLFLWFPSMFPNFAFFLFYFRFQIPCFLCWTPDAWSGFVCWSSHLWLLYMISPIFELKVHMTNLSLCRIYKGEVTRDCRTSSVDSVLIAILCFDFIQLECFWDTHIQRICLFYTLLPIHFPAMAFASQCCYITLLLLMCVWTRLCNLARCAMLLYTSTSLLSLHT